MRVSPEGGAIGGRWAQESRAGARAAWVHRHRSGRAARTDCESIRLSMLMSRRCRCS